MKCEQAKDYLVLAAYGELSFEEEEALESHVAECAECRAERARQEKVDFLLEAGEAEIPAGLLARSRREFSAGLEAERKLERRPWHDFWRRWVVHPPMWLRPVGALAMLAAGFFGARMAPTTPVLGPVAGLVSDASPVLSTRVRLVNPDESGRVKLLLEETRQRELSGELDDSEIRRLVLAAAADPGDPGLRVESIDLLKSHTSNDEVRKALLNALQGDPNSGVRLKAIEGLRAYGRDPETRRVLAAVLLNDDNPGVRTQAIDLLVQSKEPDVAGVLQELLRREDNNYVRARSRRALSEMKASVGTF